jgi:hypothetical protein
MPVAGSLPVLCASSVASERLFEVLGDILPPLPSGLRLYYDHKGWLEELERARREGLRFALTHVHAPEEIVESDYLIPRTLVHRLNDKSRIGEIVDPEHLAKRFVCVPGEIVERAVLPVVVKAVDGESVSGGLGLRFCKTRMELEETASMFGDLGAVVVEERLDLVRSDCLHFGVDREGDVLFLGTAPQLIDSVGHHEGNVLGLDPPHDEAIGAAKKAVTRAAAMGYCGLAGIDAGLMANGGFRLLDANFRINASSAARILFRSPGGALFRTFRHSGSFKEFASAIRSAHRQLGVRTLMTFDPAASPYPDRAFLIRALVPGPDRRSIDRSVVEMKKLGLV